VERERENPTSPVSSLTGEEKPMGDREKARLHLRRGGASFARKEQAMDRRVFKLELKATDDATGMFEGYAAVFGNEDWYGDVIEPGAFTKTLQEQPHIPILWQHNTDQPIGLTEEASEDNIGLKVRGKLNMETVQGREAYSLLKQGVVRGLSIGFDTVKREITEEIRRIKEIRLWEWSLVTFPANPLALVTGVKNAEEVEETIYKAIGACRAAGEKKIALNPALLKQARNAIDALLTTQPDTSTEPGSEPLDEESKSVLSHLLDEVKQTRTQLEVI